MAFPFKTGGDFYNCEAQRMRLHNLGANPTETATGLMYFNTGASNLGKHAVVHDGTNFKALAFVDEIATNAEFVELKEKVDLLIGDDVDTDTIIDSWKEVQAFLADIEDTKTLQGMLSSYLPKAGGTISGTSIAPLIINTSASDSSVVFRINSVSKTQIGYNPSLGSFIYNYSSSKSIGIKDDGTPHFGNNTLLHSGNANKEDVSWTASNILFPKGTSATWNIHTTNAYKGITVLNAVQEKPEGAPDHYAVGLSVSGYYGFTLASLAGGDALLYRRATDWKTIAFTDSNVAGAYKLVTSAGEDAATVTDDKIVTFSSLIRYSICYFKNIDGGFKSWFGRGSSSSDDIMLYIPTANSFKVHTNGTQRFVINSSGNVTIGGEDKAGTSAKLYVDGKTAIKTTYRKGYPSLGSLGANSDFNISYYDKNGEEYGMYFSVNAQDGHSVIQVGRNDSNTNAYNLLLNPLGGNVLIGTTTDRGYKLDVNGSVGAKGVYVAKDYGVFLAAGNEGIYLSNNSLSWHNTSNAWDSSLMNFAKDEITLHKKMTINGDLHVTGNIIADKEVSAGGAGQEGESGDGGAEVIDKELAKGQSSYTIPNTIGRSAVAVSLYEWNANNGSWDMCLADISVKDATITVTFGSATSVNHKLVAVG